MNRLFFESGGVPDSEFIRGEIPMTKFEVRAVSLSKLSLYPGAKVLDIGAGTGSVSVECGLRKCAITAIERTELGRNLIEKNCRKFGLKRIEIIKGSAPDELPHKALFERVFIGGSGGKLSEIFHYLDTHLESGGILVANTITLENCSKIMNLMYEYGYIDIEAVSINISRSRKAGNIHMMIAENPVTVIRAKKGR